MNITPATIIMLIVTALTAVATVSVDAIQVFWAAHPAAGPLVLLVYSKLGLLMPSPLATKGSDQ